MPFLPEAVLVEELVISPALNLWCGDTILLLIREVTRVMNLAPSPLLPIDVGVGEPNFLFIFLWGTC